ncbi:hypothetical protein [Amycolatopsis nigrescens]|uniref:hypothetical protein n=1 Tax=Amycolatopsis nigrescens TaxID=381445 RepID=UPI0003A3652E|nr:hypothetical protein [Amycolatopsis nigrescens]
MARTTLRSRTAEVVSPIQVADRTGILAASVPQQRTETSTADAGTVGAESGTLTVATADASAPGAVAPNVRRCLLLTCAAAALLMIGWIGGGMFHQERAGTPVPEAAGSVFETNDGAVQAIPAPAPAPAPAEVAPPVPAAVPAEPVRAAKPAETRKPTRKPSPSVTPRSEPVPSAPAREQQLDEQVNEQLQKFVQPMMDSARQMLEGASGR